MAYTSVTPPKQGSKITMGANGVLNVPPDPILPFIEGDGTGRDIWRASVRVFDAAVAKAYKGERKIHWFEVYAGEKALDMTKTWLPDDTTQVFKDYLVGIKGPLTTPIGGGIRSLNVALRQMLDLYACVRPVKYFRGVPSPVKHPEKVNMIIFRENTEDTYAGVEWAQGTPEAKKIVNFLLNEMGVKKIRFPESSGIGIKPISREGTQRLVRSAISYALKNGRKSVNFVHKGNIMKFTEGAFREWGYEVATTEFRSQVVTQRESWILGNKEANKNISDEDNAKSVEPGLKYFPAEEKAKLMKEISAALALWPSHGDGKWKKMLMIKDSIADITLQQTLTRADEFDVMATPNLNGDYLSDALAAQIGGIGIAPGANINYVTGHAIFEATHGTAPKYADLDKVNPGSVILSGEMMFRYMGWNEVADLILKSIEATIAQKIVTYDFARMMEGAKEVKCSAFADALIANM